MTDSDRQLGRALIIIFMVLLLGSFYVLKQVNKEKLAREAEIDRCLVVVRNELGLLAGNVLDGYDVTIADGYVTIYNGNGEVLATGKFLEGAESCLEYIGDG